jgi:hypothetical protein
MEVNTIDTEVLLTIYGIPCATPITGYALYWVQVPV